MSLSSWSYQLPSELTSIAYADDNYTDRAEKKAPYTMQYSLLTAILWFDKD